MPFTIEQVTPVIKKLIPSWARPDFIATTDLIKDYLTGQTAALPILAAKNENVALYYLSGLLKRPDQWDHNDQLVLDVLTDPAVWPSVQGNLVLLLSKQTEESEAAFAAFTAFLKKHYSPIEVFEQLLKSNAVIHHWAEGKRGSSFKATFLRQCLQEFDKASLDKIKNGNLYGRFNADLYWLLHDTLPNEADNYMHTTLVLANRLHIPGIQHALQIDKDKYLTYILLRVEELTYSKERDAIENRFLALLTLQPQHPDAVSSLLIWAANDYLDLLGASKFFGSERTHEATNNTRPPLSELAARALMKVDPQATKDKLWVVVQQSKYLHTSTLAFLVEKLGNDAVPFLLKTLQSDTAIMGSYHHELVLDLLKKFDKALYADQLWSVLSHKSKEVRTMMILFLKDQENAVEKAAGLLNHKGADTRLSAAMVLSIQNTPEAIAALQTGIATEKNDEVRDVILYTVAGSIYKTTSIPTVNQLAEEARNRGKLDAPLEAWLQEDQLPPVYYKNGVALTHDATRFLLYRMSRVKAMRSDLEARMVLLIADKEKSAPFALNLIKLFIDNGGKAEHKYLLALSALLGDEAVAEKIRITIDKWVEDGRYKMAEYGVGALALQGSDKALRWVEFYSRKYRTKKANVGAAALAALEVAAQELNITIYELGDRIVPDFGFEGLFKNFTAGGESFRAFIDSNFKIAFFNDDNKKIKSVPAATDNELKEEFKAIAKEVRDVVKSQSSRLEYYLVIQRRWTAEQWQQFFLNNPIMFIYATKLLWGVYENNQLTQCFYCQEDTTLADAEDNEVTLPEDAQIGIVHPLHLLPEALQTWTQKFFDLSVEPEFPQLSRPVYRLDDANKALTIINDYVDLKTATGSIKTTLEKYGWQKGPAEDAGSINVFFKDDHASNIRTALEVEGVYAQGFDSDVTPKLGRLYFIKPEKEKSYWFRQAKDATDPRLVPLGQLSEVFYSEVIAGISAIKLLSGSQSETEE